MMYDRSAVLAITFAGCHLSLVSSSFDPLSSVLEEVLSVDHSSASVFLSFGAILFALSWRLHRPFSNPIRLRIVRACGAILGTVILSKLFKKIARELWAVICYPSIWNAVAGRQGGHDMTGHTVALLYRHHVEHAISTHCQFVMHCGQKNYTVIK